MDLSDSIIPRSDQVNAEDLLSGPRTVTIVGVSAGSSEQPVNIDLAEYPGRAFRPSKTVRRILVRAWGPKTEPYVGRRMTIYRDPAVRFGGQEVGGIRVSHLSDIPKRLEVALTETRGKRRVWRIEPLPDAPAPPATPALTDDEIEAATTVAELRALWPSATPAQQDRIKARVAALTEEPS